MTFHLWKMPSGLVILSLERDVPDSESWEHIGTTELTVAYEVDAQGKKKS